MPMTIERNYRKKPEKLTPIEPLKLPRKTIGYLRVSTFEQNTEKNEANVLKFANDKELGHVEFITEKISGTKSWKKRKLFEVVQMLNDDDVLIVPELSRLGRSLVNVLDVLNELSNKHVQVYSVKENFKLNGDDIQSKVMRTMLGLFAEIEHDLIVARTIEGIAAARAKGKMLGRPKGLGRSRLDKFEPEIIALMKNGSQRQFIAKRYGVTSAGLLHWLKRHKLDNIAPEP
jgi:DNA invertase Pin-like site-specific DNA recombinase